MSVGVFHRSLRSRGKGAKDWSNSWTEHEYLGKDERGRHKFAVSLSVGHRVFKDKADGQWKKHKLTDERPAKDYILVQGAQCCVEVYPYYAKFFDVAHEEIRVEEERWIIQRLFKEPDTWRDVGAWNPVMTLTQDEAKVSVTIVYETDYGPFILEYVQYDGFALKHNVRFTNGPDSVETFRVVQQWSGIAGSKCNGKNAPTIEDSAIFRFTREDGSLIINEDVHSMKYPPEMNIPSWAWNEEWATPYSLFKRPVEVDIHPSGMKADFIYGDWTLEPGEELLIDPDSITDDNPTIDAWIRYDLTNYTRIHGNAVNFGYTTFPTPDLFDHGYAEWDITAITDGSTITKVEFRYHGNTSRAGDSVINQMSSQPSVQTDNNAGNQIIYDDAVDGNQYLTTGTTFVEHGASKDVGGASGPAWTLDPKTDLQGNLGVNWFAFGFWLNLDLGKTDFNQFYSEDYVGPPTPKPTLYVEYTPPAWSGKISGVTDPAKIMGVAVADIAEVKGVA